MKKNQIKFLLLMSPVILGACSQQSEVTDDFDNRVFYQSDEPDKQLVFFDGGLHIDAESSLKPYITDKDLEEVRANPTEYEPIIFDDVKVLQVAENSYEVLENEDEEIILSFSFDEETNTLTVDDEVTYYEQN